MKYVVLFIAACHTGPRATADDCGRILDRLVAIELHERGYRDPKLLETRTREIRAKFAERMKGCVGRPLGSDAMRCVEGASTSETLVHVCLH